MVNGLDGWSGRGRVDWGGNGVQERSMWMDLWNKTQHEDLCLMSNREFGEQEVVNSQANRMMQPADIGRCAAGR